MPKHAVDLSLDGRPLLDLRSFARRGPGRRDRLTVAEIEQVALTVRRAPEVMIKVLPRGTQDLKSVQRHLAYIDRDGKVELDTDEGSALTGKGIEKELLETWDLDVDEHRPRPELAAANRREAPKLVHKLIFSMPAGTPPDNLLAAVRRFAREEFGLKQRYAMALHTDEPHPHVHMLVKAISEQGLRLNIRKATLREWRGEFARHLREQGIEANATERAVRGNSRVSKRDGIFRAGRRGVSSHMQERLAEAAADLKAGQLHPGPGKASLRATRIAVEKGWSEVIKILFDQGRHDLAEKTKLFATQFPTPLTERERLVADVLDRARAIDRNRTGVSLVRGR